MHSSILLSRTLLPSSAFELGILIVDPAHPTQDCHLATTVDPSFVLRSPQVNFSHLQIDLHNSGFRSALTRALSASCNSSKRDSIEISALTAMTYSLTNSETWFKKICAFVETRKWLEDNIARGRNVYMIVGYHTVFNAEVTQVRGQQSSWSTDVAIPVMDSVSAAAGVPGLPAGNLLDVGGGAEKKIEGTLACRYTAPGERIYAIQCRKVRFKWFSSRTLENARLEDGNTWQIYWRMRLEEDDDQADDILEAELEERTGFDELGGETVGRIENEDFLIL